MDGHFEDPKDILTGRIDGSRKGVHSSHNLFNLGSPLLKEWLPGFVDTFIHFSFTSFFIGEMKEEGE
jgi:hypothetical protein